MAEIAWTVDELKKRWQPHKERLKAADDHHPTHVRFGRSCSWLRQAERMTGEQYADMALVARWIAFNALYGRWNDERKEPQPDCEGWKAFLDRILQLDADDRIAGMLQEHKRLVRAILDNEYLSRFFWEEPGQARARKAKKAGYESATWYVKDQWALILTRVVERIYLLRCQLVHGAATCGGKLNRTVVRHCSTMLGHLLPAILLVWIDYGADEDWGTMCYSPLWTSEVSFG